MGRFVRYRLTENSFRISITTRLATVVTMEISYADCSLHLCVSVALYQNNILCHLWMNEYVFLNAYTQHKARLSIDWLIIFFYETVGYTYCRSVCWSFKHWSYLMWVGFTGLKISIHSLNEYILFPFRKGVYMYHIEFHFLRISLYDFLLQT